MQFLNAKPSPPHSHLFWVQIFVPESSNTLRLRSSLNVSDDVSQPYSMGFLLSKYYITRKLNGCFKAEDSYVFGQTTYDLDIV
jgi:hypothetical protein